MKKIIISCYLLLFFTTISFAAIDIGAIAKQVGSNATSSGGACSLDKVFDDIKKDVYKKVDGLKDDVNTTIKKEIEKLDGGSIAKAKKLVDKADKEFDNLTALKDKAMWFVDNIKTIAIFIVLIIIVIIAVIIFALLQITKIASPKVDNKKLLDKIEELEKKIDLLLKK